MSRRRGGEVNALAERLARASSAEAGHGWESMDDDGRARWTAAWQPTALALRARKALPVSDDEVTTIARTHRRIDRSGSEPPEAGMKEAAQMVVDLRIRS
ncbi:hypothetical protein [Cryptosporangium japonicum]|uniref:DUF222 domain-containing protein n=1 Tax=Cryptosporangium japonicum TaxID=80872 RepID=A0ABP3DT88_9ACTN